MGGARPPSYTVALEWPHTQGRSPSAKQSHVFGIAFHETELKWIRTLFFQSKHFLAPLAAADVSVGQAAPKQRFGYGVAAFETGVQSFKR